MKIHSLIHAKHEKPGAIADWVEHHAHTMNSTNLYLGESLPSFDDFDLLVIMGGPMSVNDEQKYPWLITEKKFISDAIERGKSVLGICLGAQLIAAALGAAVRKNAYKEIGWYPVKRTIWTSNPVADFMPFYFTTFHWHGEIFDIPDGAERIFQSEACDNQAFVYGKNVVAFQFHMEITPEIIYDFLDKGKNELRSDKYIQNENDIMALINHSHENNLYLFRVLDYLAFQYQLSNK